MEQVTPKATSVRKQLDQFEEQNWNRHTPQAYESVEQLMEQVVEGGTFTPDVTLDAELSLTLRERITGTRQQDMTAMLLMGLMLGAALERDVPMNQDEEDAWREGKFVLPESE